MASGAGYDHLASRKTAFEDGDIVGVAGLHGLERAHELPELDRPRRSSSGTHRKHKWRGRANPKQNSTSTAA
jgi:hypothetical protein